MHWLYDLPLWLLAAVIIVPTVALSALGVAVVRGRGWMLSVEDNGAAGFAHAFIGVLYAVALGLMVVGVQGGYEEVESVVMQEANLAGDLYVDLGGLADPARSELKQLTRDYVDTVIDQEWPAVSRGDSSETTDLILDALVRNTIAHEPRSEHERLIYAEVLRNVNELLDRRRQRLHDGRGGIGAVTWIVVLIGGVLTIGVAWFYNTERPSTHYALVCAMAAMFSLMIFLIVAMDHPLWGKFSVGPDAFVEVRSDIQRWDAWRDPAAGTVAPAVPAPR